MEMPALSPTMSQGNIASWKKSEGEEFAAGDVLAEIETDKATMDWEAQDEGVIAKILAPDGSKDIPVGTVVAVVVEDAEHVSAFKDFTPGQGGSSAAPAAASGEPEGGEEGEEEEEEGEEEAEASGGGGDYPPHSLMGLPALSPTMSQGNIAAWKKKEGEEVAAGDSIAEIETDKATMDWESQDDGFIAKLLVEDGAKDLAVGDPVLVFVEDEEAVAAFKDYSAADAKGAAPKKKPAPKKAPKQEATPAAPGPPPQKESPPQQEQQQKPKPKPKQPSGGRVVASPYARRLAADAGVDIAQATGSGPGGRVVAQDVQQLIDSGGGGEAPAAEAGAPSGVTDMGAEYSDVKNTQVRRITAERLLQSKTTIPHYYLTLDLNADKLLELRSQLNEKLAASGGKLSLNDFIVKASALALRKVPEVNASWNTEYIRQYHSIDISVAVQTPGGLMVPIVHDADALGLSDISAKVKDLATKAKAGKLKPQEFTGGTFSISNLGMYGITEFSAIINPPQACILAVGGTQKKVVAAPGGTFKEASIMSVTLSCDHRVVDGALGAQWLQAFRQYVEEPTSMLL
ncbi:hypothetical protein CVIRNUC_008964 [Coccomyxa viridis]|uniref:Acetyltransferase component of pyruvate dehydrogenase complex n=1 Tax=Coccomyxa viridis TaxID=1274662 RepID=A0AAV1IEL2_9CHLO|nr:hypothetical protein CVIRNUC_008964 [Coccomyxa viridis]